MKINPEVLASYETMTGEEREAFSVGLLLGLVQSLADLAGTVDAHTVMLAKICKAVGITSDDLVRQARLVKRVS